MPEVSNVCAGPFGAFHDFYIERPWLARAIGRIVWGVDLAPLYASMQAIGRLPDGATVLDVPCGGGVALRALRPDQRVRWIAVDIDETMLERAGCWRPASTRRRSQPSAASPSSADDVWRRQEPRRRHRLRIVAARPSKEHSAVSHRRRVQGLLVLTILSALALSATAGAATLTLKCAGKGARNKDSAGTVLCAGSPSKGRTISGTIRNDAGQPVAGKVTLTYKSWTPAGTGYTIKTRTTRELTAKADGSFSFTSKTATKESIVADLVADPALGIAAAVRAQADVSRKLVVTVTKLGGGSVRITVKGTKHRPLKIYVLDPTGYEISGVKPKNADAKGRATFDLGSRRGQFSYYVDAGVYDDLFWYLGRPAFKL